MSGLVQRMIAEQRVLCKVGDQFPNVAFVRYTDNKPQQVRVAEAFRGRLVVAFGVPGAFTPTCSKVHVAGFSAIGQQFKAADIDVYCHAPDSLDVMRAWLERDDKSGIICALPDPERYLTSELGIGMDKHARGLGYVPKRYAMVLERDKNDLQKYIIRHLAVEDDAAQCGITSAESILKTAKSFLQ